MSRRKQLFVQAAQIGGLMVLLCGHITAFSTVAADLKHSQLRHSPSSNLTAKSVPISEADAETIENWLLGDVRKSTFGIGGFFFSRAEILLSQPNAKAELALIVARKDLPPHLRVYAQEMLMKAGQPRKPSLLEDYCYTLQNSDQINLYHELWGLPGVETGEFGKTLISYGHAALPCLSRLLNDENELSYGGNGEWRAVASGMQYRIADLAAYLITQILALPYNNDPEPAVRDQQIQTLYQRLTLTPLKRLTLTPLKQWSFTPIEGLIPGSSNRHNPMFQLPLPKLTAKSVAISEADAETIKTWLMGDIHDRNPIWGDASIEPDRVKSVLAQPNAKAELARIVARQDLPPELRVYAQEILIKAGQSANPILVEAYCQTMPGAFQHGFWGVPGEGTATFGRTLVGYGQASLPCLLNLLDNSSKLSYNSGEWGAISEGLHYRVSDLAAYFITQILHLPYNNDRNPAVRDRQIHDLRRRLKASPDTDKERVSPMNFLKNTAIDGLITQP